MGAIDLLFGAKRNSERLHQLALSALMKCSQVLPLLMGDTLPSGAQAQDYEWEPQRGLYDLAVFIGGRRIFIEMKVDSSLDETQIRRQLRPLLTKKHANDQVLYLLLGYTAVTAPPSTIEGVAQDMKVAADRYLVKTASDLIAALESSKLFPTGDICSQDTVDLAAAHLGHLRRLHGRRSRFFEQPVEKWRAGDYFGFFAHCRQTIPEMRWAGIGSVSTPNGNFVGCWWAGQTAGPRGNLFLQLSQDLRTPGCLFCIRIEVADGHQPWELRERALSALQAMLPHPALKVQRPKPLGSGKTMTIGHVVGLPFGQQDRMEEFARGIKDAEQLVEDLAERLAAQGAG